MSIDHRDALASRFTRDSLEAPASWGSARLMPTTIKSGRAASLRNGVAHLVREAAIATDETGAVLAARWECGGSSVNAVPVVLDAPYAACHHCAEAVRLPRGPVVYRCYDEAGELIYIGSTVNLHQRIRGHRSGSGSRWWGEVARVESEGHPTEAAARLAEAQAIANERPYYNRAGVPPQTPAAPPQQAARHP